ncbi:interleukin-7 isoform 1-T1 [Hipposideros larvatus]|uniref:Interleukin-7 n=1 Tax=Hipposideros armiger TaxID=186990 RepID=A0A8B7S4H5_HIPAR|nr:PREDICTED: interleukin-7 isoform X1 [Hipposideros armiger]
MFHVSFRYIFGIPPLILVLLPVASPDCEVEGKNGEEYRNVLLVSLDKSMNTTENNSNCPNNEPNFFKKHSCDDDKEAMFLKTAARKLKYFLNTNISAELKHHVSILSQGTLQLLNCTRKDKGKKQPSLGEAQPTKNLEEKKSLKEQRKQEDMCFLRILLEKIKTCWNKILSGTKEH